VVKRGEIWWYEHPRRGRRPYLILTRDEAIPVLNQLVAVPATRTIRGIPTEVALGPAEGMPTACVLSLDNVGLVRREFLTSRITSLDEETLRDVCRALAAATGC